MLRQQLKNLPTPPDETTRLSYAQEAAKLLARIATESKGPFVPDLTKVESALAVALNAVQTGPDAAIALRELPDPDAQRSLADIVLTPPKHR